MVLFATIMPNTDLRELLTPSATLERQGILISKGIAEKTIWDTLAEKNPTHAVISAKDEDDAAEKSKYQIEDIKQYLKSEDILLDFGSGYGRVAKYLLPQMPLGGYIGVDSSFNMLSLFRQRYNTNDAEQRTPVLFLNADIHTVPLQDNSVDAAVVSAVFLHNHKDVVRRSIDELKRVLKPDGTLLVYSSFPRSATAMGLQGGAYQLFLNLLGKPFKNGPVRYYSKKEVLKLFSDFQELDILPVGYGLVPKTLIFLPSPIEKLYRIGIANPLNKLFERITPPFLAPYFAVHYDIVAKR